jgi:hypothetical protein
LFQKTFFFSSGMMGLKSESLSGDGTSHALPGRVEKNHSALRSILPAFELETPSDLCDTKFLMRRFCKSVTRKEVNQDGKETRFIVGNYPLRIYSNIWMWQERRTSSASTTACASTYSASGTGCSCAK